MWVVADSGLDGRFLSGVAWCRGVMFRATVGPSAGALAEEDVAGDASKDGIEAEPVLPYPDDSGSDYEPGSGDELDPEPFRLLEDPPSREARPTRVRRQVRRPQ